MTTLSYKGYDIRPAYGWMPSMPKSKRARELVRGPKPDHVKVSTAQHRLQPSNQRGARCADQPGARIRYTCASAT